MLTLIFGSVSTQIDPQDQQRGQDSVTHDLWLQVLSNFAWKKMEGDICTDVTEGCILIQISV